jgi:hydroxyisourate hydrolase
MAGNGAWEAAGEGTTNEDGRIPGLVAAGQVVTPGHYKLHFDTGGYFSRKNISAFYPFVEVVFEVKDLRHHHVPLLLNPFGYSTYRGS